MAWLLAVLAVLAAGLLWQSAGAKRTRARQRAGYLDHCLPLFSGAVTGVAETGFARVSGNYRGQVFDIQVVPDSLAMRKLPCLWLLVTLPEPLPVLGTVDVMLRASGHETFSRFATLPDQIAAPAGFPPECSLRTDAPNALPDPAVIVRYLAGLDPAQLKELVIAPNGVRVVWLVEQADRGRYLLFRDAEMGADPLAPVVLQPLMDGLRDLWATIAADQRPKMVAE